MDLSSWISRLAAATNVSWAGNRTICSCSHNHSCSSLWAEADGVSRAAPLCLRDYPLWNLSLPLDSLGLAATDNVKGHCVAHKQLQQLTQMWNWLWRDTKCSGAWRMRPPQIYYQNILMMCKENLPYSGRQNITSQKICFQIHSTSNGNEIKRVSNLSSRVSPCNCLSRHCSNIFKCTGHCAIKLSFCSSVGGGNWLRWWTELQQVMSRKCDAKHAFDKKRKYKIIVTDWIIAAFNNEMCGPHPASVAEEGRCQLNPKVMMGMEKKPGSSWEQDKEDEETVSCFSQKPHRGQRLLLQKLYW